MAKNIDEYALRKRAEDDWRNSAKIREEFESMEQLYHFLKAEASGQMKMAPSTVR